MNKSKKQKSLFTSLAVASSIMLMSPIANADSDAELAKKTNNPIASLISMPIKLDWDTDIGEKENADRSTYVIQPVIPISMNKDWNVISRTVTPVYVEADSTTPGSHDITGMGDILQSFFFSPVAPTSDGWIWGVGRALSLPTGDDYITSDKFSVGPTAVFLKQDSGWTYGALMNQLWSISGDDDANDVSNLFLQPFFVYTTPGLMSLGINTESSYNWNTEEWTVPVNLTVTQLVKFGGQPLTLQVGYRNYLDTPDNGPDWGLRFQVTLLFPK